MQGTVYVNGAYLPADEARVSVFDRGFLFADGIYEVAAVLDGRLVDNGAHLDRLERSLAAIDLALPIARPELVAVQKEIVARNGLREGLVYMQVTRGAADRDFAFPSGVRSTLVVFAQPKTMTDSPVAASGVRAISTPDLRWARRDIKSIALLAQVLAKQQARRAGCAEAFMVEDGMITEGASSNVFILTRAGEIVTRELSNALLPGCTRAAVLALAREQELRVIERAFSVAQAQAAAECWITSATTFVMPVVALDGAIIGDGRPGPMAMRLRALYFETARRAED